VRLLILDQFGNLGILGQKRGVGIDRAFFALFQQFDAKGQAKQPGDHIEKCDFQLVRADVLPGQSLQGLVMLELLLADLMQDSAIVRVADILAEHPVNQVRRQFIFLFDQ